MAGTAYPEHALRLYAWNGRVADALRFPIEIAESALRARVLTALNKRYNGPNSWVSEKTRFWDVAAAKTRQKLKDTLDDMPAKLRLVPEAVASQLSFGFWTAVLEDRFSSDLWEPHIDGAFPDLPSKHATKSPEEKRVYLEGLAHSVRKTRNDVAHYAPVYKDAGTRHAEIVELARACCMQSARWIEHHGTLDAVLRARPERKPPATAGETAWAACPIVRSTDCVAAVLGQMKLGAPRRFVLVQLPGTAASPAAYVPVSGDDIAAWMAHHPNLEDGILELDAPISDVLQYAATCPTVAAGVPLEAAAEQILKARRNGCPVPRSALVSQPPGALGHAPGLTELTDLVNGDTIRRIVTG